VKLALLSDVHANLLALQACLAHARAAGATRFALLGDHVGYGAEPDAVVDVVMALAAEGAILVRGNHDEAALTRPSRRDTGEAISAAWTHDKLSEAQRGFLAHTATGIAEVLFGFEDLCNKAANQQTPQINRVTLLGLSDDDDDLTINTVERVLNANKSCNSCIKRLRSSLPNTFGRFQSVPACP